MKGLRCLLRFINLLKSIGEHAMRDQRLTPIQYNYLFSRKKVSNLCDFSSQFLCRAGRFVQVYFTFCHSSLTAVATLTVRQED
jgi:hypothetical protein